MEISIPIYVLYALHILTACALILIFATDCFWLAKANPSFKIRTGISPEHITSNIGFFFSFGVIAFLIISLLLAIVEICLMLKVKYTEMFKTGFYRPVIYILMGLATMGLCGDLGLAAGIITMIMGVAWLALVIAAMI